MRGARRPLRILISSGPTREPIDPVRFLSNYSTGYMGAQLAAEALTRNHRVTIVSGPSVEPLPLEAQVIPVVEAREMERAMRRHAGSADVVIMAAAVSDFRPVRPASLKLRRRARLNLKLEATPDIIARLPRRNRQLVVGFALETDRVVSRAVRKLRVKRLDVLLAQQANGEDSPFGRHQVHAWLLARGASPSARQGRAGNTVTELGRVSKRKAARALLDKIEALWYGQQREEDNEG